MGVVTEKFIRKPLYVDAVRVTPQNFAEIAAWCQGEILTEENAETGTLKKYIKVRVHNPKGPRQTKAFIGDWVLYTERGYKVYTNKPFRASFDSVEGAEPKVETVSPGVRLGNVSLTPEEKDQVAVRELDAPLSEDEEAEEAEVATAEEIREKLPNVQDRRRITEESAGIEEVVETTAAKVEHGAATGADPEFEGLTPVLHAHATPQGEPHEYVPATSQAIADVVNEQQPVQDGRVDADEVVKKVVPPEVAPQPEPISEQSPEVAAAGKEVLSEEEQRRLGPEKVRELISTGDVILAQDLAETP